LSPNVKGPTKFFEIIAKEEGPIGEFEWGQVDKDTVEIISLFIRKEFRKNKSGRNSFEAFCKKLNNPTIILKATPQSKGFWKHMGFKLMQGTKDYYKYN
jgi:N-acetylglutamate synthase-like GNAT family acetyltransferase